MRRKSNLNRKNIVPEAPPSADSREWVFLDKSVLLERLERLQATEDMRGLRSEIRRLQKEVAIGGGPLVCDGKAAGNENGVSLRKDVLLSELAQISDSLTIERARYYIGRLKKGLTKQKTGKLNDINLCRWKEYDDILTDSLWVLDRRDTSGAHLGWYWGNFIPQIPHQMMLRYTKKGDWVLDTFAGSGTTLIECRRLGRSGVGIELNPKVAKMAKTLIDEEPNTHDITTEIVNADSRSANITKVMKENGIKKFQLAIMHPPYHDIIEFSDDKRDLSTPEDTGEFLKMFGEIVDNITPHLEDGRYLVLVIGDKYTRDEWVPLGFYCMNEVVKRGYTLKSIIVKNFEETRGKRAQKELWRYRALVGGFYIFKHEYIMLLRKNAAGKKKKGKKRSKILDDAR